MYMNYKSKAQPFRRRILGRKNSIGLHLMSMGIGLGCYQEVHNGCTGHLWEYKCSW